MKEAPIEGLKIRTNELYGRIVDIKAVIYEGEAATQVLIEIKGVGQPKQLYAILRNGNVLDATAGDPWHMVHIIRGQYEDITPRQTL